MTGFPKPHRGEALSEKRQRRVKQVAVERSVMQAAKARDGRRCRVPGCHHRDLPLDACHLRHRGMGGNPKLDRTTLETVISLCRWHHGEYDAGSLQIHPLTNQVFSGPCEFQFPLDTVTPAALL